METMKAIALRKAVRAYKKEQITEDILNTILSAGCAAPVGWGMYDKLHLTVIQDKEIMKRISANLMQMMKTENDPLYGVPTLILVSSKELPVPNMEYSNAACILENMMLMAADHEIGSVVIWGTALAVEADESLKEALSIPDGFKAIISAGFGYSADTEQKEKELKVTLQLNRV